jgi:CarD family transcriptional regulator
MLSVGEKVVHRFRGAGVITEEREMRISDTPHRYFVIQMIGSRSTVMVPTHRVEQSLRLVCERATLQHLLTSELTAQPSELPQNYRERAEHIESKLKSGETAEWIRIVRDLTCRQEQGSSSSADRQLLEQATDLLAGELALAQEIDHGEARTRLASMIKHRHELNNHHHFTHAIP